MESYDEHELTGLLNRWAAGDPEALQSLLPKVYASLHRLAAGYAARERPGHTLGATALVHEAYLRLYSAHGIEWQSREHFLAVAARVMRRILVDYSRRRSARRRGGEVERVSLLEDAETSRERAAHLVRLDDALEALARFDPRGAQVVELRFFGGLSLERTARCLGVSRKTVVRDWRRARAWLRSQLAAGAGEGVRLAS